MAIVIVECSKTIDSLINDVRCEMALLAKLAMTQFAAVKCSGTDSIHEMAL